MAIEQAGQRFTLFGTEKFHLCGQVQLARQGAQVGLLGTLAHDRQGRSQPSGVQQCQGAKENVHSLVRNQPADKN